MTLASAGLEGWDDEPRAMLAPMPMPRHIALVEAAEARFGVASERTDTVHLALELLAAALDVRNRVDLVDGPARALAIPLALSSMALGEASARMTAQREGYFPAAAAHRRSATQGAENLASLRATETWWRAEGKAKWLELRDQHPESLVKQLDFMLSRHLAEVAGDRHPPTVGTIRKVRTQGWGR